MSITAVHFNAKKNFTVTHLEQKTMERLNSKRKYELGELLLEAGLDKELSTVLLGMLSDAKTKLDGKDGSDWRRRWWLKGDKLRGHQSL